MLRIMDVLRPEQRRFFEQKSKRKYAHLGRRAGKSFLALAWLIDGGLAKPGGMSVYVSQSKLGARATLDPSISYFQRKWPQLALELREIDGQFMLEIGLCRHLIWLSGAKNADELNKFRGRCFSRVAIDEAPDHSAYLGYMVNDVFEPCLIHHDGELGLFSTSLEINRVSEA